MGRGFGGMDGGQSQFQLWTGGSLISFLQFHFQPSPCKQGDLFGLHNSFSPGELFQNGFGYLWIH